MTANPSVFARPRLREAASPAYMAASAVDASDDTLRELLESQEEAVRDLAARRLMARQRTSGIPNK